MVTLAVEVEDEDQVYESSVGDKVEGDGDGDGQWKQSSCICVCMKI